MMLTNVGLADSRPGELPYNICSVSKLDEFGYSTITSNGLSVVLRPGAFHIKDIKQDIMDNAVLFAERKNGLYLIEDKVKLKELQRKFDQVLEDPYGDSQKHHDLVADLLRKANTAPQTPELQVLPKDVREAIETVNLWYDKSGEPMPKYLEEMRKAYEQKNAQQRAQRLAQQVPKLSEAKDREERKASALSSPISYPKSVAVPKTTATSAPKTPVKNAALLVEENDTTDGNDDEILQQVPEEIEIELNEEDKLNLIQLIDRIPEPVDESDDINEDDN
jgi:hypothetical protein